MQLFWRSAPWISTARLMKHFLATCPYASANMCWEHEFTRSTGINSISDGFDQARGWQRYQRERFDCLVLRSDVSDAAKCEALSEWTGVEVSPIAHENSHEGQSAPGVYERLKSAIDNKPAYVDAMLALPSMHGFYNADQRAALRAHMT